MEDINTSGNITDNLKDISLNSGVNNHLKNTKVDDVKLHIDISDAVMEKDKVKFTVFTKTTMPTFAKREMSVIRQHEEFVWLYNSLEENTDYFGYIIPPVPPQSDFAASQEKLYKLGEGEGNMTKEEFKKMKNELELEYLAAFKKTVALHETFLCRLATHPVLQNDINLRIFLEYDQNLSVRGKNRKELFEGIIKSFGMAKDEILLQVTQRDVDEFFVMEKNFVTTYYDALREIASRTEKVLCNRQSIADTLHKVAGNLMQLSTCEVSGMDAFLIRVSHIFDEIRKSETSVYVEEDLRLCDTLRYYIRDCVAVKSLLYKRLRALADYEQSTKSLEKARVKNKDVHSAELAQQNACDKFDMISKRAKSELTAFKKRRVSAFRKNLVLLAETEVAIAQNRIESLKKSLEIIKAM